MGLVLCHVVFQMTILWMHFIGHELFVFVYVFLGIQTDHNRSRAKKVEGKCGQVRGMQRKFLFEQFCVDPSVSPDRY